MGVGWPTLISVLDGLKLPDLFLIEGYTVLSLSLPYTHLPTLRTTCVIPVSGMVRTTFVWVTDAIRLCVTSGPGEG